MKPIVLLSNLEHQCVSFVWPHDLSYFVGYRFVEHQPQVTPKPLLHRPTVTADLPPYAGDEMVPGAGWLENWQTTYAVADDPLQLRFHCFADGSATASVIENGGLQERSWHFLPQHNGVRLLMTLRTNEALRGSYIVQQCLRLSSGIGYDFRQTVARVPFLSELLMQALGNANGTITWARVSGRWHPFPVPYTQYHTQAGAGIFGNSAGQTDYGLIVRETAPRDRAPASYWREVAPDAAWETWSAGLCWERAAAISNRHPADCLHVYADLGPLDAGATRTVQGKFYWMEGTKDDLLAACRQEFDLK
jgi:hypothetical protein